jgi:predicted nucleotidyltransferase
MPKVNQLPITISGDRIIELCQQHHIQKLSLFGSVLRDDFRSDSDIDVLVEFVPGQTPGFAFIDIQDQLSVLLGRQVDLNTPQDLSRYFRDQVLAEAEVIYAQNG